VNFIIYLDKFLHECQEVQLIDVKCKYLCYCDATNKCCYAVFFKDHMSLSNCGAESTSSEVMQCYVGTVNVEVHPKCSFSVF